MKGGMKWKTAGMIFCILFGLLTEKCRAMEDSLGLYARGAVLMDGDSGRILYGKEEDTPWPMASTTKIMTCILALEEAPGDTVCTASSRASGQAPVKLGMKAGDTFYLKDLLYSLMLESHNDTAVCIAETVGGSVEEFAEKMNRKAVEIGCYDTFYITPNGLDAETEEGYHHTTARELALVMRYCLTQSEKADEFLRVTGTLTYEFTNTGGTRSYSCTNHNAFLSIMEGALSGKTGFTGKAGYCYVGALKRDDRLFIVALLGCGWPNHKGYKWVDTKKLMNYGLENYEKREFDSSSSGLQSVPVVGGKRNAVELIVEQSTMTILMKKEETARLYRQTAPHLQAPVEKNCLVGTVSLVLDGEMYGVWPVRTAEAAEKIDYSFCIKELLESFMLTSGNVK